MFEKPKFRKLQTVKYGPWSCSIKTIHELERGSKTYFEYDLKNIDNGLAYARISEDRLKG